MNKFQRVAWSRTAAVLLGVSALLPQAALAAPVTVNIAGVYSQGAEGASANRVLTFDVGPQARITGVSYDVNLTSFSRSWLSEMSVLISDSTRAVGTALAPAEGDDFFGTGAYQGGYDLVTLGLDFLVASDGVLRLEFFDTYFDAASPAGDGVWNAGSLTVNVADVGQVPEPASLALMGLALLLGIGATPWRRRADAAS